MKLHVNLCKKLKLICNRPQNTEKEIQLHKNLQTDVREVWRFYNRKGRYEQKKAGESRKNFIFDFGSGYCGAFDMAFRYSSERETGGSPRGGKAT